MADTKKPIDTLRTKDATELALTDYLIGHDDGSPAAFRTPLESLAEALAPELILPIIGQVETNANGSWVRLENGLQVCWHELRVSHAGNARNLAGTWTFPQPFVSAPVVPASALPTSSSKYSAGLALASLGHPFIAAGSTTTSASVYVWENSSPFTSGQWVDLMVFAIGRWK